METIKERNKLYAEDDRYIEGKYWFYCRCSSKSQTTDRQVVYFTEKYNAKENQIIKDVISGKVNGMDRVGFNYLLTTLARSKDCIVIDTISRLGRSYKDILKNWQLILDNGIYVKVEDQELLDTRPRTTNNTDIDKLMNDFLVNLITNFLAFAAARELKEKKRAQMQGIEAARKMGKNLGRPKFIVPENFTEIYLEWKNGKITATCAMRKLNMSHSTFYRVVKEYNNRKM